MHHTTVFPSLAMLSGIGGLELIIIAAIALFFFRRMFWRGHGGHAVGCVRGLFGAAALIAVSFVLLRLTYLAVGPRVHHNPAQWTAFPQAAKVPILWDDPFDAVTNAEPKLSITLDPEKVRQQNVTSDEVANAMLALVDNIRLAQRAIVDGAVAQRRIELKPLEDFSIRPDLPLTAIARVKCVRPLGAPDQLLTSITLYGSGNPNLWQKLLYDVRQRLEEASQARTDDSAFEVINYGDQSMVSPERRPMPGPHFSATLVVQFNPVSPPGPPVPVASSTPQPTEAAAETRTDDAASVVAGVAAGVATSVAEAIKTSLEARDDAAPESTDTGAVARKIAAHAVAALLNATVSNQSAAPRAEAVPAEAPPTTAVPPAAVVAEAPLPAEPAAQVVPEQPALVNDEAPAVVQSQRNAHQAHQERLANVRAAHAARRAAADQARRPAERIARYFGAAPALPISLPTVETKRPAWLDNPPVQQLDEQGVFRLTGSTGALYSTPQDSVDAVAEVLDKLTRQYLALLLGDKAGEQLDLGDLPRRLAKTSRWTERVNSPVSALPLYETHVLVEFDEHARRTLEDQWRSAQSSGRLVYALTAAGVVLGLIGTLFGYLKLDTATRGYYSGRLKLAAGTFVSILVAVAFLILSGRLGI